MSEEKIRVGISVGDVNGIGMEIIIKSLADNLINEICTPIVYGSSKVASYHRKAINMNDFNFNIVKSAEEAHHRKNNLISISDEEIKIDLGQPTNNAGSFAFQSLEAATQDLIDKKIDVLVTAPIDKKTIQSKDFEFPGHTEYLASKSGDKDEAVMLMIHDNIKVAVVTGHIPLKDVAKKINSDVVFKKIAAINRCLIQDFAIEKPKIAVLGLNPHAGDGGLLGTEEKDELERAIREAKNSGMVVFGPYPADGFFSYDEYTKFDVILAMYHDQGLIPFKLLAEGRGVNYTGNLSFIRTSPAHGTAYNIAGKGEADETSFRNAIYAACDAFKNRKNHLEAIANPLPVSKKE